MLGYDGQWDSRRGITVSVATECGRYATRMRPAKLHGDLLGSKEFEGESKDSAWMISYGYSAGNEYERNEGALAKADCVIIDCDNSAKNPNAYREFVDFCRINRLKVRTWETPSSTSECPRWRAVFELHRSVEFSKDLKTAVRNIFTGWCDDAASWYNLPTADKSCTYKCWDGLPLNADVVENEVAHIRQMRETEAMIAAARAETRRRFYEENPEATKDYHGLPSVKKVLAEAGAGNWNTPVNAALYGMANNGYERADLSALIDELEEIGMPNNHVVRFRRDIENGVYV